jgi:uncharacterized protein YlxW (UPF0749 family)
MSDDLTGDRPRPGEHSDVEDSGPGSDDPRGDESSAAEDARETGVDGDVHGDGVLDREPDLDSETELSSPVTPTEETAPDDRPRRSNHRRAAALIGVLLALLGFGIAVQVRANSSGDSLSSASNDDLIRILDDQNSRADRLRQQIAALQATEQQLEASGNRDSVALAQAQQQEQALSILLGTVPTTGPGVRIVITDPRHQLKAEDLLDVIEELRGAGAEAIQFGSVRVSTSTAFLDAGAVVTVDGTRLSAPYTVLAIGDPQTLDTALQIPGGVRANARADGGDAAITEQQSLTITAVRPITNPTYAKTTGR